MIEQEIKFELESAADFSRFLEGLEAAAQMPARLLSQTNHYLDTRELTLAGRLVMFRIRESSGVVITLKSGTHVEDGYFRSREVEAALDPALLDGILARPRTVYGLDVAPVQALCHDFGELQLECIGTLRNMRRVVVVDGHTVEIDQMQFGEGDEEYEVEIESARPDEVRHWCLERFRALGVEARPSTETKFQRLLGRLGPVS